MSRDRVFQIVRVADEDGTTSWYWTNQRPDEEIERDRLIGPFDNGTAGEGQRDLNAYGVKLGPLNVSGRHYTECGREALRRRQHFNSFPRSLDRQRNEGA
jgi:hypothetical protein